MKTEPPSPTVRQLRRRWKPHKQRLLAERPDHPMPIRFHRACSWLARVEKMSQPRDDDFALLAMWIGFNALYGRWNTSSGEPESDYACWRQYLSRILTLDGEGRIRSVLTAHKRLVIALFDDPYLSAYFWDEPTNKRAGRARKSKFDARSWYVEEAWELIVERLMDRIYLMRCQLVHGASTYGGKLNRTSLKHCATMQDHLVRAVLEVIIDHGADEDWGPLCYPPVRAGVESGKTRKYRR
jgi:hypothetical protein